MAAWAMDVRNKWAWMGPLFRIGKDAKAAMFAAILYTLMNRAGKPGGNDDQTGSHHAFGFQPNKKKNIM